jgi:[acyl-carrier-protein] S-malonyltransferase
MSRHSRFSREPDSARDLDRGGDAGRADAGDGEAVLLFGPPTAKSKGFRRGIEQADPKLLAQVRELTGLEISQIARRSPEDLINSQVSESIVFVLGYVFGQKLIKMGLRPAGLAGHSVGQLTALALAEALDFATALRLVQVRSDLIEQVQPPEELQLVKVLGLPTAAVEDLCEPKTVRAWPVTINAHDEVLLRGTGDALGTLAPKLRERGAERVILLMGGGALHTPLMAPAAERMRGELGSVPLDSPRWPVASSVSGSLEPDPDRWRELLARELESPVRWHECMRAVPGEIPLLEVGVVGELEELAAKVFPNRKIFSVDTQARAERALSELGKIVVPA